MFKKLIWVAMGTMAIGTESFVIAGVLPDVAKDLSVTVADAGQLVAMFALVYGLAAPLLATFTGHWPRERVLRAGMALFAAGNLAASLAPNFASLMVCRVLLALCASLYSPTAAAYASSAVTPEKRGRALAFVMGGVTVATVLGVPIATFIGNHLGWRYTFALVGVLATIAFIGLCLPRAQQERAQAIPLAQRLAIARRPPVWRSLIVTWLAFSGGFCIYTYISPLAQDVAGAEIAGYVPLILMLYGVAGAIGNIAGGHLVDRNGAHYVIVRVLIGLSLVYSALAGIAEFAPGAGWSLPAVLSLVFLWGVINWQLPSVQQHHLIKLEPQAASIVLSLQASFLYLGVSTGAVLGSLALRIGSTPLIAWTGALCELLALLAWLWGRSAVAAANQESTLARKRSR